MDLIGREYAHKSMYIASFDFIGTTLDPESTPNAIKASFKIFRSASLKASVAPLL